MRLGWWSVVLVALSTAASAQLPTRKYLPVGLAVEAAMGAIEKCEDLGQYVAAAVVEPSGQALVLMRHDRAKVQSLDTARNWAQQGAMRVRVDVPQAPARLASPSDAGLDESKRKARDDMRRLLEDQRRRTELTQRRMAGLPIEAQDVAVAQIAVAGAFEPQNDLVCAKAGIDRIRVHLK